MTGSIVDKPEAAEAILSLAVATPGRESFDATLQQIVELARAGVTHCSMAGITLLEATGPTTAAATSKVAEAVDAIQYRFSSGPCLDAYRHQVIYRIESTDTDERWPEFSRGAAAAGVRSVLSFPLVVSGDGIGALNLYSDIASGFDTRDEKSGAVFAAHASVTLAHLRAYWRTDEVRRNLEEALASRGVIDQAKGILIAREGFSADDAFEVMRRASQRANRRVHDLAQEIVDEAQRGNHRETA
jgi:GAF domain-containing protein